jgi:triacylglycerol esterase/lipase EstA (alpha/beta hydrolase family)
MTSAQTVHLVVLVHGMWGNPGHLAEMDRIIRETRGPEPGPTGEQLRTLVAKSNSESGTYDGIDWGAERVAQEVSTFVVQATILPVCRALLTGLIQLKVFEEIKHIEDEQQTVTKFSVVGYSLGGLVARYLVGILHQRKFFEKVAPMNFCTVATPHIGLIRDRSTRWRIFSYLGPRLLSRTGEQFFAVDQWASSGRPLVEVLADPGEYQYCFSVPRP